MTESYKNFIGGEWVAARSGKTFENRNPADNQDLVGTFPDSDRDDLEAAVKAARGAYDSWRKTPAPHRGEILYRAGQILKDRKEELAKIMTREMGKVLKETRGDVQEAIDTAFYAAGEGRRLFGDTVPCELPNKFGMSVRCPIGVCVMITPWNFPMAIPSWKIFPALICGNTVVFKPATDTPASAAKFVEVLQQAGVPAGVVNFLTGGGSKVGMPLAEHPQVDVVSFTGSTEVGRRLAESCGRNLKRLSLEMGGKNAQIVMDDADLDLAVEGALWGGFGTTGQRCTATSRVVLHEKIADAFMKQFVDRVNKLRLGNGLEASSEVGPLVNQGQVDTVEQYVKIGKDEGAKLVAGGSRLTDAAYSRGFFYRPTVFDHVKPTMRIAQEEIFGPVVSCLRARSLEEAIEIQNGTIFGLSSSIYTRDVNKAFQAIRDIQAGITYVNSPTIGAEVQLPFGGVKQTGNGHREAGQTVYDIFSEWKSVYVDYSGRLQKAQIDVS
ncbi:MAG: aldehyde dehydrogenase family protein [Planctomycetes bacterium]|nr:aldehyde dehydrogenase family protein [Planctomycetota bacterium]MBI3846784.1 aldehyde dehydrogenase family protein [Planctomycetota bacterium]